MSILRTTGFDFQIEYFFIATKTDEDVPKKNRCFFISFLWYDRNTKCIRVYFPEIRRKASTLEEFFEIQPLNRLKQRIKVTLRLIKDDRYLRVGTLLLVGHATHQNRNVLQKTYRTRVKLLAKASTYIGI